MTQRVHPMTAALVLAIVLVGVMLGYSHRLASVMPKSDPVIEPQGPLVEDDELGVAWTPDVSTHGYLVSRILPSPRRSRLGLIGVRPSDVLTDLNERGKRFGISELRVALDDLERDGKPFSLTVRRAGEQVVLRPTTLPKTAEAGSAKTQAKGSCADGGSCAPGGSGSCADGEGGCSLEEGKAAPKKRTASGPEPVIGE